jgi:hypothetical protein
MFTCLFIRDITGDTDEQPDGRVAPGKEYGKAHRTSSGSQAIQKLSSPVETFGFYESFIM